MRQHSPLYRLLQTGDNSSTLGRLCRHAQYLHQLTICLRTYLEPPLNEHCKVANYANATLIIHADTAAWAARLRYNTPAILTHMRSECNLQDLKTLRIKITPPAVITSSKPARQFTLSRASANVITHTASLMPDDELRLSLLRLARHTQKKD